MAESFDEEDYESLPPTTTLSTHLMAGAAAGIMEHSIMYPVDSVKTRMQILVPDPRANYSNIFDALYRIVRYEGIRNTVRGLNAVVYGAGPAHAMYFACYEKVKKTLSTSGKNNTLVHGFAGGCATLLHDAVMNPADVIKQRMQVYNSQHKSCLSCAKTVWETEGFRAFYRSYITQLTMNVPFQCIHFIMYEFCQDHLNKERQYNPATHMICGGMAGALASAVTTPLDVCKTLLNTQESCAGTKVTTVNGLTQALKTVYEFRGPLGFFQGVTARVVYVMPGTAISWSVYEFFKYFITKRQNVNSDGYVTPPTLRAVSSE